MGDKGFGIDNNRLAQYAKEIKNILDQNNDFEVILIGLDGGIKLRQDQTLLKQDLFRIIDAMPMRRNEIRN